MHWSNVERKVKIELVFGTSQGRFMFAISGCLEEKNVKNRQKHKTFQRLQMKSFEWSGKGQKMAPIPGREKERKKIFN